MLKTKLEKLFDTTNAKQYYQTYLKKKQTNKLICTYNVEIMNCFNHELQLKDTESAIKNKLKHLLTELKGFSFRFMKTLVLGF